MNIVIDIVNEEDAYIINLSGEIDVYTAPQLKETLLPLMKKTGRSVIVNMKDVGYMDSTGLGVFISALKAAKEHESKLKLVNLQERVHRLFKITGLDEIIDISMGTRGGNS